MKYMAVLHNVKSGVERVESILYDTEGEANRAGETGLEFYGGTHFTIEEVDSN